MESIIRNYNTQDLTTQLSRLMTEGAINPDVRNLATDIVSGYPYPGKQISVVYDYIISNVQYQPSPIGTELFIAPWRMVTMIQQDNAAFDCDQMALLAATLLRSIGYDTKIIIIDSEGGGYDHAYCEVRSPETNEWLSIDCALGKHIGSVIEYKAKMEVL
jgi:transglutaminase-like putative cysteine protease